MRTDKEILDRYAGLDRFFDFEPSDLLAFLPFEKAKPRLKADAKAEDWGDPEPRDHDALKKTIVDYLEFAWGKCQDHRGLSAGRSIDHFRAWLWMDGEDELVERIENDDIPDAQDGAPILKAISVKYGVPIPDDDATRRMMRGDICEPGGCSYGGCE